MIKDWVLWKNMHQIMSRNKKKLKYYIMLQSLPKYFISIEIEISAIVLSQTKLIIYFVRVVKYCVLRNFGCLAILSNIMKPELLEVSLAYTVDWSQLAIGGQ